jgi:hypothetical protein
MHLYELSAQMRAVYEQINASDLDPQTIADSLEAASFTLEQKVRATVCVALEIEAESAARYEAGRKMMESAASLKSRAQSLRDYVRHCLQGAGVKLPLRFTEFDVNLQKNPPAVLIEEPERVPRELCTHVPETWEPSKKLIGEALKAGREVPGARVADPVWRLVVR